MAHSSGQRSSKLPHSSAGILWGLLLMMCLTALIEPSIFTDVYRGAKAYVTPSARRIQSPAFAPNFLADRFDLKTHRPDALSGALLLRLLLIVGALCAFVWVVQLFLRWAMSDRS